MNFTDYNAFRVAVQHLFEGDDSISNTFSTATLDILIGLGEERVYHGDSKTPGLRASPMVSDLSVAVASNAATLPADLLELKEVYFSGKPPLDCLDQCDGSNGRTAAEAHVGQFGAAGALRGGRSVTSSGTRNRKRL